MTQVAMSRMEAVRSLDWYKNELEQQGWTMLPPELLAGGIQPVLAHFGSIVPQFDGSPQHEVTYRPGYEALPYSQSTNEIGPHTEAPAYDPPPKYLALFCHRQARCGGGYTMLADGFDFFDALPADLQAWVRENEIQFSVTTRPGSDERQGISSKLISDDSGTPVIRFSYNQFNFGDVNPTSKQVANRGGQEDSLVRIANCGVAYFEENAVRVLIPENSLFIFDNRRMLHARSEYSDQARHLTRYFLN